MKKFKLGDKVKIVSVSRVGSVGDSYNEYNGNIGILIQIDGGSQPYLVEFKNEDRIMGLWCEEIKHHKSFDISFPEEIFEW